MPFDDPACFRLDRISVRPIHWLSRPYLDCGNPALLDSVQVGSADGAEASVRPDAAAGELAPRRGRPACAERRPSSVAVVEFDLAARRQLAPMRVRGPDPRRARGRLTALAGGQSEAPTQRTATIREGYGFCFQRPGRQTSEAHVAARIGDADCRDQKLDPIERSRLHS